MYFVAAGKVEIELPDRRVQLSTGQFFLRNRRLAAGLALRDRRPRSPARACSRSMPAIFTS
jgi:hypothetical protein